MSVAGTAAITELWAKCKAWFGRKLGASTTATTISIHLKNNAGDVLETATIAAASTTDAGPMSADDKTKLNGIATGATANAATTTTPKMDGTAAVGSETAYAKGDHVHPTDTSRAPLASPTFTGTPKAPTASAGTNTTQIATTAFVQSAIGGIDSGVTSVNGATGAVTIPDASSSAKGLMTTDQASKLDGIATGAQANQNAFSNVKVGSTTIAADTTTDTIEIVAGSNVTLTPDATNDKLTIAASNTDTKNTAGSTDNQATLYLIGAPSQAANPQTYSNAYVSVTNGDLTANKFNGVSITTSSLVGYFTLTTGTKSLLVNGSYTLAEACTKAVDTSFSANTTSTNLPTSKAVAEFVASQAVGAAMFQGTLVASGTPSSGTWDENDLESLSYKKGWYWVCQTAGTYTGKTLEAGDMLFCVSDKASSYAASDFTAVQNNLVEMTTAEVDAICV